MNFKRLILAASTILIITSCSLNYDQETQSESKVPEFIFTDATLSKYENRNLTMQLTCKSMEQYKDTGSSYAQDVKFNTFNKDGNEETKGSCGILSADTRKEIYTFFNNINIQVSDPKMQIIADSLKWMGKSEQLISGITDIVYLKRDDVELQGRGFSASGVSRTYSFTDTVSGTVDTDKKKTESTGETK